MMAVTAAVVAVLATQQCPDRALGPGTHVEGGTRGAACILAAFHDRCRSAYYSLTGVGIGTIAVRSFNVRPWNGHCAVLVISTITIGGAHGHPVVTGPLVCRRLRRVGADVVVDRCSTGATRAFSLTRFA